MDHPHPRKLHAATSRRRGQAMTEFAMVLPLLAMIFLGVTEMGFILNDYLSQVQANGAAAKFGSRLFGNPDANALIIDHFLENRGNLSPASLTFHKSGGSELGSFTKTAGGALMDQDGGAVAVADDSFFVYDGGTPDNAADDTPISCMNVRASYVKVKTVYNHQMMVPGIHLFSENGEYPIHVENIYPLSPLDLGSQTGIDPSDLEGAFPITVMDQPFIVGQEYILKGKSDEDPARPGNFGWVNLDPSQPGNKNENIAAWINGPNSPSATIPGWLGGFTGQRNAADIRTALNVYAGKYIVIMVHDSHQGNGNNLQYHEVGLALFRCESFTENTDGGGQPHLEISGNFVRRLF